jgi:hypothetical protein
MMLSLFPALLVAAGCASQEGNTPTPVQSTVSSPTPLPPTPQSALQACIARIPTDATPGQRSLAEQSCQRAFGTAARAENEPPASGAEGDTLQACMSRIPRDASAGQRMIAEESCKRDEAARRSVNLVPGSR